jgi:NitT/TauT family transport system substrate-binding protein
MPQSTSPARRFRHARLPIAAIALALLASLTGCGLLGDSDSDSSSPGGSASNGPLEKSKIKVGVLPVVDVGPFYLAVENGYFKAEGLEVEPVVMASGQASVNGVINGDIDIAFGSWPAAMLAQSKKVADFKIVAEALAAKPGHVVLGAPPNSPAKRMQDLPGKRVAVTAKNTMCDLAPKAVLESQNVDFSTINWIEMPFPEMIPALARGDVDAACLVEPWNTRAAQEIGAVPLVDGSSGPTADMPMAGFVVVAGEGKFGSSNPNTIAAFQRGLAKAAAEAQDRAKVEPVLVKHVKIDEPTAKIMTIATYPTSLDPTRLQRVPDLMQHFGVLSERVDVSKMILAPGGSSGK